MASVSEYGSNGLFHGQPDQNIYPSQFVQLNPHHEQPRERTLGWENPLTKLWQKCVRPQITTLIMV